MEQTWFEKTWPGRALDAAAFWCARVAGTSRRPARPEPRDGMGAHQWFLCAGLAVMLCIPHFWWDNLYGVAFSLAVLLTGWREAVRHGRCPLRPTATGARVLAVSSDVPVGHGPGGRQSRQRPGGVVLSGGVCPDLHCGLFLPHGGLFEPAVGVFVRGAASHLSVRSLRVFLGPATPPPSPSTPSLGSASTTVSAPPWKTPTTTARRWLCSCPRHWPGPCPLPGEDAGSCSAPCC